MSCLMYLYSERLKEKKAMKLVASCMCICRLTGYREEPNEHTTYNEEMMTATVQDLLIKCIFQ